MDYFIDKEYPTVIDRIVFNNADGDIEGVADDASGVISVFDSNKNEANFYIKDVDNLIAALQKAKELCGDK